MRRPKDRRGVACSFSCMNRYARPVDGSWRCDETYIKVKGRWSYLYRAVDKHGRTVDFLLSERRDVAAAKRFFRKGIRDNGTPRVITLDTYAASHRAVRELKSEGHLPRRVRLRSCKYLNNIVEQDHRRSRCNARAVGHTPCCFASSTAVAHRFSP